ncbi:HEPN domain-containing protein [Planctomycetota bacterium]
MTSDVEEHFQSANEFLKEGAHLMQGGFYRGAVGRAYYAMFHAVKAILLSRGIERSSHHAILSAFGEHIVKPGLVEQRFHTYIRKAFARRNECDYLSFTVADEPEVETILNRAKEFVEVCRNLCE